MFIYFKVVDQLTHIVSGTAKREHPAYKTVDRSMIPLCLWSALTFVKFRKTKYFNNQTMHWITSHEKLPFSHPFFFTRTLFSLASFHREVRGQGQLQSSEPRAGKGSVSCSNLLQQDGCLPTQRAWTRVPWLRDGLFNHWGSLPSLMFVMPRLWPRIKAGVALQPQSWCQSKPICPVMTDMTWPNPCESRGNMTELYGVRLPQLLWEMASIRVQH